MQLSWAVLQGKSNVSLPVPAGFPVKGGHGNDASRNPDLPRAIYRRW